MGFPTKIGVPRYNLYVRFRGSFSGQPNIGVGITTKSIPYIIMLYEPPQHTIVLPMSPKPYYWIRTSCLFKARRHGGPRHRGAPGFRASR